MKPRINNLELDHIASWNSPQNSNLEASLNFPNPPVDQSNPRQIVFIDSYVSDYQTLFNSLPAGSQWFVLNAGQDGIEQIQAILANYSNLDAIQILSHGSQGSLYLGNTVLNNDNIGSYSNQLARIGTSLTESGDILLYGCNVAQGETGNQFIQTLAQYIGADVAASTDLTGDKAQGGDWVLEAATGAIEAGISVSSNAQQNYNHALDKPSDYVLAQMSNLAYSNNPSFDGWVVQPYTYLLSPGFFAVEFQKGNDIVIAFRGTNTDLVGSLWDATADLAIKGFPNWDPQFDYAIQTANIIREANPNAHIYVTGHSLGGALAQVVSQMFGFEGATFEPGGAQNIVNSTEFSIEASAIGITPAGVPTRFFQLYG